MIDKFFDGELKYQIMKYCNKLETISKEYDVLIFMARKSICFYDALILNNDINKTATEVVITTSSRILSYDCEFLKGKKIALLDDIVVKGNTLNETINFLLEKNIVNFDVYYIASQEFKGENSEVIKAYLKEPILELDNNEVLILGNSITNYISASACSYNVDYPVFYMDSENGFFEKYIQKNHCIVIPSCSGENRTNMYVQHFDCKKFFEQYNLHELEGLKHRAKETILKLRIFYRPESEHRKIIVIPIIVLPELQGKDIKHIFEMVASNELKVMVQNDDEVKMYCNMLNVVQYMLAYQLFSSVFRNELQYTFKYSCENQNYIFPQSYSQEIRLCLEHCENTLLENLRDINITDDFFVLSEVYNHLFDFIGERHKQDDAHGVKFSFKEVLKYCEECCSFEEENLIGIVSTLFDYAIDTGLIVPDISVFDNRYLRSYRLSEQYELQEKQFDLIIFMYNEYQKKTQKKDMSKIGVEKLLVLFFKEVISKILNEYKIDNSSSERPKNVFGITYARFGPVVADSKELGVSKDNYLTKRLFDDSRSSYKRLYENKKEPYEKEGKIYVKESDDDFGLPQGWQINAKRFVSRYDFFERLLNFYNVFNQTRYIKTFDQFLIMAAIGESKDNQLLSLAAELRIYQIKVEGKVSTQDIITAVDSIMDGMVNGIWKYLCYKNVEYKNCYAIVAKSMSAVNDRLRQINKLIKQYRDYIESLRKINVSSVENLKENVTKFLTIFSNYKNGKQSEKYIAYRDKFNANYTNASLCNQILKDSINEFKDVLYKELDQLHDERYSIDPKYIDIEALESLFVEQNSIGNRSEEISSIVENLMDEATIIIYEILSLWNKIVDSVKNKNINIKIYNEDKNSNYLKRSNELLKCRETFANRLESIEKFRGDLPEICLRLQQLVHEIDILMFCINQYILKNDSKFIAVNSFYVVKRDDGNDIEINEILQNKRREKALNAYLDFMDSDCQAAFVKSKQSKKLVEQLSDFAGYTLIDYDCNRGCNTLIKAGETCYSKRVNKIIKQLLNEYTNKIIEVTDGGNI